MRLELILRLPEPSKSEFRVNSHYQAKGAGSPYSQNQLSQSKPEVEKFCSALFQDYLGVKAESPKMLLGLVPGLVRFPSTKSKKLILCTSDSSRDDPTAKI